MAIPFFFTLFHLIMVQRSSRPYCLPAEFPVKYSPTEMSQRSRFLTRDVVRFVSANGTMVCLELGFYYGAILSWRSALVIILLTIGGICLFFLVLYQSLGGSATVLTFRNYLLHQPTFETVFAFLWGASYYSFNHYFRKSSPRHACRFRLIPSSFLVAKRSRRISP